jgi:hypothetical protein
MGGYIGTYTLSEDTAEGKELKQLLKRTVDALRLTDGVTHMEAYCTHHGMIVGEITCRPGGGGVSRLIEEHHGVSMWDAFLKLATGERPDVIPQSRSGISGWIGLPGKNGKINSITAPEVLHSITGVESVEMKYRTGDWVNEKSTSVFFSGMVFYHADTKDKVRAVIEEVTGKFYIETEECALIL